MLMSASSAVFAASTTRDLNARDCTNQHTASFAVSTISRGRMATTLQLTKARRGLLLLLLAGLLPAASQARAVATAANPAAAAAVVQLARGLQDSPLPMRTDFAWLAVTQMAEFYSAEAARARTETRNTARAHDVSQWAASVDNYAQKLAALAESITSETPISISVGADDTVQVYVGGQPVILTEAISGQQSVYEQQLLERFCVLYRCEDLLPDLERDGLASPSASAETAAATVYWSFSQHAGPVCMTDDGLEFQFQQLSGLGEKRAACNRVVAELHELAQAIVREQQQGVRVNWDALQVLPGPADEPQRVLLAARVEIRLALPMLVESPKLLKIVRPWLSARTRGESYPLVVLNAGQLMGLDGNRISDAVDQRYPAFNNHP